MAILWIAHSTPNQPHPIPIHTRAAKRLEKQAAAEKAKADAALAAAASSSEEEDDDDDDDDGSEDEGGQGKGQKGGGGAAAKAKAPVTKLPSALELLETTTTPAFLSVPAPTADFDVMPMKAPERWVD